eukprot:2097966-Pleurochrysis_carterae.AAC.1
MPIRSAFTCATCWPTYGPQTDAAYHSLISGHQKRRPQLQVSAGWSGRQTGASSTPALRMGIHPSRLGLESSPKHELSFLSNPASLR